MTIKVRMYPHLHDLENHASGIAQVIKHYFRYLPDYDIELVDQMATSYDLDAAHAAAHPGAMVNHLHGLLWTGEFDLGDYGHNINRDLVCSVRLAREVTVPSAWVAMPFQRDMHFTPHIIPHGVEWAEWQHNEEPQHVLWAKNRPSDGLDPNFINQLARAFPDIKFLTTFAGKNPTPNLKVLGGAISSGEMKKLIQQSLVFVASDRETFGIGPLEAMAAGVPVLTVAAGAVPELIYNKRSGAWGGIEYTDFGDAVRKLREILARRDMFSHQAARVAADYSWQKSVETVAAVYRLALQNEPPTVDVVIPCHNYHATIERAVRSAMSQPDLVQRIIVVDDSSEPGIKEIVADLAESDSRIEYHRVAFGNVALARNYGARKGTSKYLAFLDADDAIEPGFTPLLANELERDHTAGIAYTSLLVITKEFQADTLTQKMRVTATGEVIDGGRNWPVEYDYQKQLGRHNQIPSGCLVRRKAFERAGGFMPLYCPEGAGSEDAELWLRLGAMGWGANYVVNREAPSRWIHYSGEGHVSGREGYAEPDWTALHPWTKDQRHPLASIAEPVNGVAHVVYSYEKPVVSVIVPCGPGHEQLLVNCLHSIEGQTLREWELIVVWDGVDNQAAKDYYAAAFPFATFLETTRAGGPGAARNAGVDVAKGEFLAFVDADDRLMPTYLERHLAAHRQTGKVVYSDWVALVDAEYGDKYGRPVAKVAGGKAYIPEVVPDWDCRKATAYPEGPVPYNAVGTNILLPRQWFIPFDETLATWEDILMTLQLAWAGRQFHRIPEPLWFYDLSSGTRRFGRAPGVYQKALERIQQKYREVENMCGCENEQTETLIMSDNTTTLDVIYNGFGGTHWEYGAETGKKYAYVTKGDVIKNMDKRDVRSMIDMYLCAYCGQRFQFNRETAWCNCGGQGAVQPVQGQAVRPAEPKPTIDYAKLAEENNRLIQERRQQFVEKLTQRAQAGPGEAPVAVAIRPDEMNDNPLETLDINFRSLKALHEEGITTVGEAQEAGEAALLEISGVGRDTVQKIMGA